MQRKTLSLSLSSCELSEIGDFLLSCSLLAALAMISTLAWGDARRCHTDAPVASNIKGGYLTLESKASMTPCHWRASQCIVNTLKTYGTNILK
jgi:hypothetical protein